MFLTYLMLSIFSHDLEKLIDCAGFWFPIFFVNKLFYSKLKDCERRSVSLYSCTFQFQFQAAFQCYVSKVQNVLKELFFC